MQTDPRIASGFESWSLPPWTASDGLRSFVAGLLLQLKIKGDDIVNTHVAMDYIQELTSGITGRIVELVRLSARCAIRQDVSSLTIGHLQDAGKLFAFDLGSGRVFS